MKSGEVRNVDSTVLTVSVKVDQVKYLRLSTLSIFINNYVIDV